VASRSSSTLPTGPNQNLSRNTISSSSSPATVGGSRGGGRDGDARAGGARG
jgi:hypothetical protein